MFQDTIYFMKAFVCEHGNVILIHMWFCYYIHFRLFVYVKWFLWFLFKVVMLFKFNEPEWWVSVYGDKLCP